MKECVCEATQLRLAIGVRGGTKAILFQDKPAQNFIAIKFSEHRANITNLDNGFGKEIGHTRSQTTHALVRAGIKPIKLRHVQLIRRIFH